MVVASQPVNALSGICPTPTIDIPVRRPSFEEHLSDLPRYFGADGNVVISYFLVHLSAIFPPGEDYFVRSVRRFRHDITDPLLKEQVKAFIGQEAIHGREHRALNERLADLGYRVERAETGTEWAMKFRFWLHSPMFNLASTAAIEHFTAVMGELFLDTDLTERIGHEGLRTVFMWHALEECEHKAVAFDVYRHVGGSERMRRWAMNDVTLLLLSSTFTATLGKSFLDRKILMNPVRLWRQTKEFLDSPLFEKSTWRKLRAYNKPGFHPNDFNTDHLVERVRNELFGPGAPLAEDQVVDRVNDHVDDEVNVLAPHSSPET